MGQAMLLVLIMTIRSVRMKKPYALPLANDWHTWLADLTMTPLKAYQDQIDKGHLFYHPEQYNTLSLLEGTHVALVKRYQHAQRPLFKALPSLKLRLPIKGLYLFGQVGIGKSIISNLFFQHTLVPKKRFHFHDFMRYIHESMHQLQGKKDPIKAIARTLSRTTYLLCLDEFFVRNVADAMILKSLLIHLIRYRVCLLINSNIAPEALYHNGLQYARFKPTITLIKDNFHLVEISEKKDFRQQGNAAQNSYVTPLTADAQAQMEAHFARCSDHCRPSAEAITILGRPIDILYKTDTVLWASFSQLCGTPRSTQDYLILSEQYPVLFISEVPEFSDNKPNQLLSFIYLIDILYENENKLIISAATPPNMLYRGTQHRTAFNRTASRLVGMQHQVI